MRTGRDAPAPAGEGFYALGGWKRSAAIQSACAECSRTRREVTAVGKVNSTGADGRGVPCWWVQWSAPVPCWWPRPWWCTGEGPSSCPWSPRAPIEWRAARAPASWCTSPSRSTPTRDSAAEPIVASSTSKAIKRRRGTIRRERSGAEGSRYKRSQRPRNECDPRPHGIEPARRTIHAPVGAPRMTVHRPRSGDSPAGGGCRSVVAESCGSGVTTTPHGRSPTRKVRTTRFVAASSTDTSSEPPLAV